MYETNRSCPLSGPLVSSAFLWVNQMADPFPLALRGVYAQPYLVKGRREFYAVDSRGEQVASRLVPDTEDPRDAISDLWFELNTSDPLAAHLRPPSLRLVR